MKLETRIRQSIIHRKDVVFSRSELSLLGSQSQVTFVLSKLVENGELLRVSRGVYAKAHLMSGKVKTRAPADRVVRDTAKKLGIQLYSNATKELKNTKAKTTFIIETKPSRKNRTLKFNGIEIILRSHKKSQGDKKADVALVERMPTKNIKQYVLALANQHNVSYIYSSIDQFADSVTSLAGDDVKHDRIEDLLVALKRAGKLSMQQVALLSVNYLRERHASF
jgi:predicted transcriptional regulator of viral defense system